MLTFTLLIVRIMRVLTAVGFATEADVQSYVATPLTQAITKPSLEAAVKIWYVQPHTDPSEFIDLIMST